MDAALRAEVLQRVSRDQAVRERLMQLRQGPWRRVQSSEELAIVEEMRLVDEDNRGWFRTVLREHGWPGPALLGSDVASQVWLIAQHADDDPDFQAECLSLLTIAVEAGDADPRNLAYLTDRVLLAHGKPQLYATQMDVVGGEWKPRRLADPETVDQRRAEVGLEPLDEYLAFIRHYAGPAQNHPSRPTDTEPT